MKPDLFYAMGLMTRAGFYTHLGYWLSDQCNIQTKVGTFAGKDKMSAIGGIHTLTGCIVDQYMQILAYLNNHAPDSVIIAGLFAPFSDRLNELLFARLTEDERLWAQKVAQA